MSATLAPTWPKERHPTADAIDGSDPEVAHSDLDDILYTLAPAEVQEAADRLFGRCRWWACA